MKKKIEQQEVRLKGVVASPGIAIGKCFKHVADGFVISKRNLGKGSVASEKQRLQDAIAAAAKELRQIHGEADRSVGPQLSKIFEAQLLILEDTEFLKEVNKDIDRLKVNAEYAYNRHLQKTLKSLRSSQDTYLREMASDISATASKVFNHLIGVHSAKLVDNRTRIALAEDFSPGEVVLMNKYRIPGFATMHGGPTSHMALIAKSLSIPGVVGVSHLLRKCPNDAMLIVDGDVGCVIINPSEQTLKQYTEEQRKRRGATSRQLKTISRLPSTTKDGRAIEVLANLELPSEIDQTLAAGKVGVGLYRTEFFYLSTMTFPTEEQQTESYREIARTFFPNPVYMRTFDLGSDKLVGGLRNAEEANPALGWRGIRFDLDVPEIFNAQIRALLKASEYRNVKIMLPMVSTVAEIVKTKRLIHSAMKDLRKAGVKIDEEIEVGIMVEVPSAALMANELAEHADFFSIGTNDLVQYTLAVDRTNKRVGQLYRELHPAVLKLIKMTIDAGRAKNITVSMCGELAGNPLAIPLLVGLGLTSFSVGPVRLRATKKLIANLRYSDCEKLAVRVMALSTPERVEAGLHDWCRQHIGEIKLEE